MKVRVFEQAISSSARWVFDAFAAGVRASGDDIKYVRDLDESCDVACYSSGPKGREGVGLHKSRSHLIGRLPPHRRLVIESPAFRQGLKNPERPNWWRASLGGFLWDDADYGALESPPDRWERIAAEQGIKLRPFAPDGETVLVILQKSSDASLRGRDIYEWAETVCTDCRKRLPWAKIVVRFHPLEPPKKRRRVKDAHEHQGSEVPLAEALARAARVVTYTSLTAIEAICAGKPTYALSSGSLAFPVRHYYDTQLQEPPDKDYRQWLSNLGYCQWTIGELREGTPWRRLRARLEHHEAEMVSERRR